MLRSGFERFLKQDMNISHKLVETLAAGVARDDRIVFAYLYGSALENQDARDVDIAVYIQNSVDPLLLCADTALALSKETGIPPDTFDVRVINEIVERGDVFGLLYLRNVLETGRLLADKDPDLRGSVLDRYGLRYRECEGLIQEVLA